MYARSGTDLLVLVGNASRKQWWRNVQQGTTVSVLLRGRSQTARATVVKDEPERSEALRAYLARFPRARKRLAATDVIVRLSPIDGPHDRRAAR